MLKWRVLQRRPISQRYLIRRVPNEQAMFSVSARNQGGRRTGPRTNLTGLQIGSAFPETLRGPRDCRTPPPPARVWKQMTLRAISFTFHRRGYRNGSIVCKARAILPLGTFSVSIKFSFSRNYRRNVDKESRVQAIFHPGPFITPGFNFH